MLQKCFFILLMLSLSFVSCTDDESLLPKKYVYLELDLTFRDKVLKDVLGHKTYINQGTDFVAGKEYAGYGGVLVVNTILGGLRAFDMACPSEAVSNIRVEVDDLGLNATCPKCSTTYEIGESGTGGATNAKKLKLTRYYITSKGNNKYIVSN